MRPSAARIARLVALALWAGYFIYLMLSGEEVKYVGPKTAWVVPFGASLLTPATLVYAVGTFRQRSPRESFRIAELAGLVALLAPMLVAFMVPGANLGALAVERKGGQKPTAPPPETPTDAVKPSSDITIYDVAWASQNEVFARQIGVKAGIRVELSGLVSDAGGASDPGFDLARFVTRCCAADAIPYTVYVVPDPSLGSPTYEDDDWLTASGTLTQTAEGEFQLVADTIEGTATPDDPYS